MRVRWLWGFFEFCFGLFRDWRDCRRLPEARQGTIKRPKLEDLFVTTDRLDEPMFDEPETERVWP